MKKRILTMLIVFAVLLGSAGCANGGAVVPDDGADENQDAQVCGGPTGESQGGMPAGSDQDGGAAAGGEKSNAPGIVLQALDGSAMALSDFGGQIVIVNFWASWCPPCRREMPDLDELDKELKESGDAVLITVNLVDGRRETVDSARQYIEENGFGFTVLIDEQGVLASEYSVSAIPHTIILDRNGDVASTIIGATTKATILERVAEVE